MIIIKLHFSITYNNIFYKGRKKGFFCGKINPEEAGRFLKKRVFIGEGLREKTNFSERRGFFWKTGK